MGNDTVSRLHLQLYNSSGAELIMGAGQLVAPKTVEVRLNGGGTRQLMGDRVCKP